MMVMEMKLTPNQNVAPSRVLTVKFQRKSCPICCWASAGVRAASVTGDGS
jgi:hypothetical protein